MTEEQIIKGLECCTTGNMCEFECPYNDVKPDFYECTADLAKDSLALIKRQTSQISIYKKLLEKADQSICDLEKSNVRLEMMNAANVEAMSIARAEAIREYADKVTALVTQRYYFVQSLLAAGEEDEPYYGGKSEAYMQANIYIAEVLKEMTEEQK
jgi:hypothetical protein